MKKEKQAKPEKKPYLSPQLIVHGDVSKITQGNSTGWYLDANFTIGTHINSLTFGS